MKYILWKQLKTKSVKVFESPNINDVVKYAKSSNLRFSGFSYVGQFATYTDEKRMYSIQGQYNGIVCSYKPDVISTEL